MMTPIETILVILVLLMAKTALLSSIQTFRFIVMHFNFFFIGRFT